MFVIKENNKPMPLWGKSLLWGFSAYVLQVVFGLTVVEFVPSVDRVPYLGWGICWAIAYIAVRIDRRWENKKC